MRRYVYIFLVESGYRFVYAKMLDLHICWDWHFVSFLDVETAALFSLSASSIMNTMNFGLGDRRSTNESMR